jgi:hypothetical protein
MQTENNEYSLKELVNASSVAEELELFMNHSKLGD